MQGSHIARSLFFFYIGSGRNESGERSIAILGTTRLLIGLKGSLIGVEWWEQVLLSSQLLVILRHLG